MLDKKTNLSGTLSLVSIISLNVVAVILVALLQGSAHYEWLYSILNQFMLVFFLLLVSKTMKYNVVEDGYFKGKIGVVGILITVITAVCLFLSGLGLSNILTYALQLVGYVPTGTMPVMNDWSTISLGVLTMCVLPAICEESVLRGGILPGLRKSYGTIKGVVFCALMFALLHGSIAQSVHQFTVGLFAGLLVIVGKSLWYGVILHFCNNCFTIVTYLLSLGAAGGVVTEITPIEFFSSVPTVVLCVVFVLAGLSLSCLAVWYFVRYRQRKLGITPVTGERGLKSFAKDVDNVSPIQGDISVLENKKENVLFWIAVGVMSTIIILEFVLQVTA